MEWPGKSWNGDFPEEIRKHLTSATEYENLWSQGETIPHGNIFRGPKK